MTGMADPRSGARLDARIPVSLLTGFLGSGKTTVLNHLVRDPTLSRTLVIINEFGDVGLDHELVAQSQEDVVVEMSSGCLCCTVRHDLVETLRNATWRFARNGKLWFDRVVIETTGLADPAPVLHTLMTDPIIARKYRLDAVIATVDAVAGMATFDRQIEAVKQAAVADRLLLTKTDIAAPSAVDAVLSRLTSLNPGARVIRATNGEIDPQMLLHAGGYDPASKSIDVQHWMNAEAVEAGGHDHVHGHEPGVDGGGGHHHDAHHHDVNRHGDNIRSLCLTRDDPLDGDAFVAWLETLISMRGEDLLRVKGLVNIKGQAGPLVIHGVQHVFPPPVLLEQWPGRDRRTRIVFIVRDMDDAHLKGLRDAFTGEATGRRGPEPEALGARN
jgi:G3E family GTPase